MNTMQGAAAAEWRSFWALPIVAAFGYATSVIHIYSIGPFYAPLAEEFGWSRAEVSSGITVASIVTAFLCIPVGMFVDRLGPRRLALGGILLMTGAYALLSTASGAKSNWLMLWTLIAVGTFGVQATVWTSAVASRFEKSRGLAFAITLSGASVAATLFPIVATRLIDAYDWRTAFQAMGGLWAALVFPLIFLFFRGARDAGRRQAPAPAAALKGLSVTEGLRSLAFYKLVLACFLFTFAALGVVVHFVPILTDAGVTRAEAAGTAALIGVFSIVGRLGTGFLLDRFPARYIGAIVFLLPIVACALLLQDGGNSGYHALAAAVFGLTVGSEVDVVAYLAARHFGLKNFGALYGAMIMALSLGTAFGPFVAGDLFDKSGSYDAFLTLTMALLGASSGLLASLGAPPLVAPHEAPASKAAPAFSGTPE